MGQSYSTNSTTAVDNTVIRDHMREMNALRSNLCATNDENDFLRRRITDLTEYASLLEEDLKKEKLNSSEKDMAIEKYIDLWRKIEEKCRSKERENESLVAQNNKLLFDLCGLSEKASQLEEDLKQAQTNKERNDGYHTETDKHEPNTPISQIVRLHNRLEKLIVEADLVKSNLLKEINQHKFQGNDDKLTDLIYEHNQCKAKLQEKGIIVGETDIPTLERNYRILCLKNNENKISVMKEIYKIENDLKTLSKRLNLDILGTVEKIKSTLDSHEVKVMSGLKYVSFEKDNQQERSTYENIMKKLQDDIRHFEKLLKNGAEDASTSKPVLEFDKIIFEKIDDSGAKPRNTDKGWSFDVFN